MCGQGYGTSYQGRDEAHSSCVTLLLLKSSALIPPGEDKCSQAWECDSRACAVRQIKGWGIVAGIVDLLGFTRALQGWATVPAARVVSPAGRAAGMEDVPGWYKSKL